jgi:hypothetical protein
MTAHRYTLLILALAAAFFLLGASAHATSFATPERPPVVSVPIIHDAALTRQACDTTEAAGCFDGSTVYLATRSRWTREHELAHATAALRMSDAEQSEWTREVRHGLGEIEADAGWNGYDCDGAYCFGSAEVFADAAASCRLGLLPAPRPHHGRVVGRWPGGYGYSPDSNAEQRRVCARISRWLRSPLVHHA